MTTSTTTTTQLHRTDDGVALAYDDSGGDGIPLILLHGWGQTREMFRGQRRLAPGRRVITLDLRGHGESDKPSHGYRVARLARDVRGFIAALEAPEVDVLGWSMGASVLWSTIDQFGTSGLGRAIFVDQPAAVVAAPWISSRERAETGAILDPAGLYALAGAIRDDPTGTVTRDFVRSMFGREPDPELWDFVRDELRAAPRAQASVLLVDHASQDWRDLLPRIDVPSLVIGCVGSHVTPASQRFIASRIPGARLHLFDGTTAHSHFPFLEDPDGFNAVVDEFLRR